MLLRMFQAAAEAAARTEQLQSELASAQADLTVSREAGATLQVC